MRASLEWTDLALFAAVARAGGLAPAAELTGASAATLSRRMTGLERRMAKRLFLHGRSGYAVTADGRELLQQVERMEASATDIDRWRSTRAGPMRVRISAGTWTSQALARDMPCIWHPGRSWVPEFLHCNRDMDIARREIDIGIRNRRPEQSLLAGRRTGIVDFAVYGCSDQVTGWIGATGDAAATPSARWVAAHHRDEVVTTANDPRLALAMAEAGIGRIVLPVFFGRGVAGLRRLSAPIRELQSEEWLVAHHEARHEPPIRAALEALAQYLSGPGHAAIRADETETIP